VLQRVGFRSKGIVMDASRSPTTICFPVQPLAAVSAGLAFAVDVARKVMSISVGAFSQLFGPRDFINLPMSAFVSGRLSSTGRILRLRRIGGRSAIFLRRGLSKSPAVSLCNAAPLVIALPASLTFEPTGFDTECIGDRTARRAR